MKGYEFLDYSLTHLSDERLLDNLSTLAARDRANTAALLAHIVEIEDRGLHRGQGYSSMHEYCIRKLHFAEYAAFKRIRAARAAREFPEIFRLVADGRLHLTAIVLLAPHLCRENCASLLAEATHRTKAEIERLLAARFPQPDVPTRLEAIPSRPVRSSQLAPGPVEESDPALATSPPTPQLAPGPVAASFNSLLVQGGAANEPAPGPVDHSAAAPGPAPRVTPLSPERYALQTTVSKATYDKLQHAKNLLAHQVPGGDLATVLDRALDALIAKLEKQRYAASDRPRAPKPKSSEPPAAKPRTNSRHIPAAVRRAVVKRDGGRCTHVSPDGRRCDARARLEFDHIVPYAKGGEATEANIRQRCRAHNQFEAERVYGREFMKDKRQAAAVSTPRVAAPTPAPA